MTVVSCSKVLIVSFELYFFFVNAGLKSHFCALSCNCRLASNRYETETKSRGHQRHDHTFLNLCGRHEATAIVLTDKLRSRSEDVCRNWRRRRRRRRHRRVLVSETEIVGAVGQTGNVKRPANAFCFTSALYVYIPRCCTAIEKKKPCIRRRRIRALRPIREHDRILLRVFIFFFLINCICFRVIYQSRRILRTRHSPAGYATRYNGRVTEKNEKKKTIRMKIKKKI